MVETWVVVLIAAGGTLLGMVFIATVLLLAYWVRKPSQGVIPVPTGETTASAPGITDFTAMRSLGERLALLEAQLPVMGQSLQSYEGLTQRVADIEGMLPNIVEAYKKYANLVLNAEKSSAERYRLQKKKEEVEDGEQSVGDAAKSQMGMAANPSAAEAKPAPDNGRRKAGVYGQGGKV